MYWLSSRLVLSLGLRADSGLVGCPQNCSKTQNGLPARAARGLLQLSIVSYGQAAFVRQCEFAVQGLCRASCENFATGCVIVGGGVYSYVYVFAWEERRVVQRDCIISVQVYVANISTIFNIQIASIVTVCANIRTRISYVVFHLSV